MLKTRKYIFSKDFAQMWINTDAKQEFHNIEILDVDIDQDQYDFLRKNLLKVLNFDGSSAEFNKLFDLYEQDVLRDIYFPRFVKTKSDFNYLRISLAEACALNQFIHFLQTVYGKTPLVEIRVKLLSFIDNIEQTQKNKLIS